MNLPLRLQLKSIKVQLKSKFQQTLPQLWKTQIKPITQPQMKAVSPNALKLNRLEDRNRLK